MITGKLAKLWIEAFVKDDYSPSSKVKINGVDRFYVQVNPESYKKTYRLKYASGNENGTVKTQKYIKSEPIGFSVDLIFDGTGVIPGDFNPAAPVADKRKNDVTQQIKLLNQFCIEFDGEIHRPRYLKFCWGTEDGIFKGVLTSMAVDYKLFKPDGTPLRATVNLSLESAVSAEEAIRREDNKSPDITHKRTFKNGDRFPLMVNEVYDSQSYYIDVARANGMLSFRKIEYGTSIQFPPIK